MTQKDRVLKHLEKYGAITPKQAWDRYGISRLSSIILRLKRSNHEILTSKAEDVNRYGEPVHYAKYVYLKEQRG